MKPVTLIFRQYGEDGRPLRNGYIVEREAFSEEDKSFHIADMLKIDYELEAVIDSDQLTD